MKRIINGFLLSVAGLVLSIRPVNAITIYSLDGGGGETLVSTLWHASPFSPAGGTGITDLHGDGTDWEVLVGIPNFGSAEFSGQASGIYGGGTLLAPNPFGYKVYFDFDGFTWDSYNSTVPPSPGALTGYWDLFALNINLLSKFRAL